MSEGKGKEYEHVYMCACDCQVVERVCVAHFNTEVHSASAPVAHTYTRELQYGSNNIILEQLIIRMLVLLQS